MARAPWQADDIDGLMHVTVPEALRNTRIVPGAFVDVQVDHVVDDYDFAATLRGVVDTPAAATLVKPSRQLPLVGVNGGTAGSFGR